MIIKSYVSNVYNKQLNKIVQVVDRVFTDVEHQETLESTNQETDSDFKKYVVITKDYDSLDSIYNDLETDNNFLVSRKVECVERRPISRNTTYLLTKEEAEILKSDSRVENVVLHIDETMVDKFLHVEPIDGVGGQIGRFDRTLGKYTEQDMVNWGLLRHTLENQDDDWGGQGTHGDMGSILKPSITAAVELTNMGENVDIVIVDDKVMTADHPEWFTNPDGTGENRLKYYNWYQHNPEVKGTSAGTYPALGTWPGYNQDYINNTFHPNHVAGIAAGAINGWAKKANIYHISYSVPHVFDYIRAFHKNKPINPVTGRKNPTICNNSWGNGVSIQSISYPEFTDVEYRGVLKQIPMYTDPFKDSTGYQMWEGYLAGTIPADSAGFSIYSSVNGGGVRKFPDAEWIFEGHINGPPGVYGSLPGGGTPWTDAVPWFGPYSKLQYKSEVEPKLLGPANLRVSTTPSYGTNSQGYWEISVPFYFRFGGSPKSLNGSYNSNKITNGCRSVFNKVYVNTNMTVTFEAPSWETTGFTDGSTTMRKVVGSQSVEYVSTDESVPAGAHIKVCAGHHSIQRIYYGVEGKAPNRIFRIRVEGDADPAAGSGTKYYEKLGRPGMLMEYQFFEKPGAENDTDVLGISWTIAVGQNNSVTRVGNVPKWELNDLANLGFANGLTVPALDESTEVDIREALNDGIHMVCSSGNSSWYSDLPDGMDYNNRYQLGYLDPGSDYYLHRGQSPGAPRTDKPTIQVGSMDSMSWKKADGNVYADLFIGPILNPEQYAQYWSTPIGPQREQYRPIKYTAKDRRSQNEKDTGIEIIVELTPDARNYKSDFSNWGRSVDIYAAGSDIMSALTEYSDAETRSYLGIVADFRNKNYYDWRIGGTSMASPQVCGILACALEVYPNMTPAEGKEYILKYAKENKMLNGASALYNPSLGDDNASEHGNSKSWYGEWTIGVGKSVTGRSLNMTAYYMPERKTKGTVFPKVNFKPRPTTGVVYPRPRIRRT